MAATASALIQRVWNYAHVLRDDGLAFRDYTEQITFLLFLKLDHEREQLGLRNAIPPDYNWGALKKRSGDALELQYAKTLRELGKQAGLLGVIFAKAQNKITDPAKLERLTSMIDSENWAGLDMDVKGEIYEGLLRSSVRFALRQHLPSFVVCVSPLAFVSWSSETQRTCWRPACCPSGTGSAPSGGSSGSTGNNRLDGCSASCRIVTLPGGGCESYW